MAVIDAVRSLIERGAEPEVVFECRTCGTTVRDPADEDVAPCPSCGGTDIVAHEIP